MSVRHALPGALLAAGLVAAAPGVAGDLGYPASALGEFSGKPRSAFDNAPPLAAPFVPSADPEQTGTTAPAQAPVPAPVQAPAQVPAQAPVRAPVRAPAPRPAAAPAPVAEAEEPAETPPSETGSAPSTGALEEYEARCFVKLQGRVVIAKSCRILREPKEVIFEIDEGPLTIKLRQGRVWTARLKDRDLGAVYQTGPCWGAKGFYACDRGRI
ncbi:hypothetical protein [Methylosinus sp. LW4]|uniref:hypothetical protein n=1 Tax=Methylosinus sp. LW4 TaxID=136993 RepID=UPI0003A5D0F4|nr:hypothetical protein [Methylosinus sp. LW4]